MMNLNIKESELIKKFDFERSTSIQYLIKTFLCILNKHKKITIIILDNDKQKTQLEKELEVLTTEKMPLI